MIKWRRYWLSTEQSFARVHRAAASATPLPRLFCPSTLIESHILTAYACTQRAPHRTVRQDPFLALRGSGER
eukprot:COSAG03_NODE_4157_length_1660_cov_1.055734_1_plen_71_part_10